MAENKEERLEDVIRKELISQYETKVKSLKDKITEIETEIEREYIINYYKSNFTTGKEVDEILDKYGVDLKYDNEKATKRREILLAEKEELETVIKYCNKYIYAMKTYKL